MSINEVFAETQLHSFVDYILSMTGFYNVSKQPDWQSLSYLLSGPLQRMLASD